MVVMILERVPKSLRGELTRWFLEAQPNVFVGRPSARVRELVWELACSRMRDGSGTLIHSANNEQGYSIRFWGATTYHPEDFEGLTLIRVPKPAPSRPT